MTRLTLIDAQIPLELAEVLVKYGPDLIERLRLAAHDAHFHSAESKTRREEERKQALERYKRNCIQAYRIYRRLCATDRKQKAHKLIADRFGWSVGVVEPSIAQRRRQIAAYLKKRRKATVLRLAKAGYTNKEIGAYIGFSIGTVARLLKEAKTEASKQAFPKLAKGLRQ